MKALALLATTLLLGACSYSENGGERWSRIQLVWHDEVRLESRS